MSDSNHILSEMKIEVTHGEFHRTHNIARVARDHVREENLSRYSADELERMKSRLRAGQGLSRAEDGPDFMFAPTYNDEIKAIEEELERR
ncbi:MAG: hypothetical protein Q8O98_00505 [bacterium]|nr:hypothetical protein [bacterium]